MTTADPPGAEDRLTPRATVAVGLCAAALSFSGLYELAVAAHYPAWLAWCYPVCVDAYGLTAARVWLRGVRSPRLRGWARASSIAALAISMGAGGLRAFQAVGELPTWAVFTVSTLPGLMLGLAVHLLVLLRIDAALQPLPEPVDGPATADAAPALPAAEPPAVLPAALNGRSGSKKAAARAYYDAEIGPADRRGSSELGQLFAARFGVHAATGRQWVVAFRRQDAAADSGLEAAS